MLNIEKTFQVRRLLENHSHYVFHSLKINYARSVVKNDSNDKTKADACRIKYDRRNTAEMKPDEKLPLPSDVKLTIRYALARNHSLQMLQLAN